MTLAAMARAAKTSCAWHSCCTAFTTPLRTAAHWERNAGSEERRSKICFASSRATPRKRNRRPNASRRRA
eukprot:14060151-Alexandrium_andersonii.AAC.1